LFRYSIYSTEYGFPINQPYDEDKSIETAIEVCKIMGSSTKCRWFVFDNRKGIDVFVFRGDITKC
jgi:hypothetical protein